MDSDAASSTSTGSTEILELELPDVAAAIAANLAAYEAAGIDINEDQRLCIAVQTHNQLWARHEADLAGLDDAGVPFGRRDSDDDFFLWDLPPSPDPSPEWHPELDDLVLSPAPFGLRSGSMALAELRAGLAAIAQLGTALSADFAAVASPPESQDSDPAFRDDSGDDQPDS